MGVREEALRKLAEAEQEAWVLGGVEKIEKLHAQGKLTARERIDLFCDKGTFVETNAFAEHQCYDFGMEKSRPPGDGVVTGWGKVNGRLVYLYAQDPTVLGGSTGHVHIAKVCNLAELALQAKCPFVGLVDSAGARIQEGSGTYLHLFYENIKASGIVPQLSVILGNCAGGGSYSPALTDFVFMVDHASNMFITGPKVIKAVTGEEISMEDLGGARANCQISGNSDFMAKDEKECIEMAKKLLSFLPQSYLEKPPIVDTGDDPERRDDELFNLVPDNPRTPFNVLEIIRRVVDNGDFFEVKAGFARSMVTGFARIGGYTIGIVANQSMHLAGSLDCDASDKAARFYRVCDCFNVPIVCVVDVPGYLPGVQEEHKGIVRHGAKMLYGYSEATVPKITLIIRKAYGGAYAAMGAKGMGADLILAWPSSEIAVMGPEGAIAVLYRKQVEAAEDKQKAIAEITHEFREKFTTPYYAASKMMIETVINPRDTRRSLFHAIEGLWDKKGERPPRKHGNIPL
jgi:acetyl-CoA carboxylase carboxyltransferase component